MELETRSAQYHLLHHALGQQQFPEHPCLKGHQQVALVPLVCLSAPLDSVEPLDGTGIPGCIFGLLWARIALGRLYGPLPL